MSVLQLQPPQKKTVVEAIIEQLIARIQDGILVPGDKLPSERELIEMLSVSRSSVREALQGLAAMDLIEIRPGHGTFIKHLKPHFALNLDIESLSSVLQDETHRHLNQARLILESGIVELAAQHINPESRQVIADAVNAYEVAVAAVSERNGWPGHNAVHLSIAEAAGNPILVQLLQSLLAHIPRSLRMRTLLHGTPEDVNRRLKAEMHIHRQLAEAVMAGDVQAAGLWIRRHGENENHLVDIYHFTERQGQNLP